MFADLNDSFSEVRNGYNQDEVVQFFQKSSNEGFNDEEKELGKQYISPKDFLLLVGGGGGREALAWSSRGNAVAVADLSIKMAQVCRRAVHLPSSKPPCLAANAVSLPFKKSIFDHVIFCDSVYNHIPGRKHRQKALLDAAVLVKGGFLIVYAGWLRTIDFLFTDSPFARLRVVKQWLLGNFSAREPGDACLRRLTPSAVLPRGCFFHYFRSEAEVREELLGSGLQLVQRIGGIWILKALD